MKADEAPTEGTIRVMSPRFSEALIYAASLHRHQPRKGTDTPYIAHLLAVSALVLEDGGSEVEAIGALLHDAAEDHGREILPYIRQVFGEDVAAIVEGCSDDLPKADGEKRPWKERKVAYVAHLARTTNESLLRVSAADKLHNARTTATDLRRAGWPPSNTCIHHNLWYYDALDRVFAEKQAGSRTAECLAVAVAELFERTADVARSTVVGDEPPECGCAALAKDRPEDPMSGEIPISGPGISNFSGDSMPLDEVERQIAEDAAFKDSLMHDDEETESGP